MSEKLGAVSEAIKALRTAGLNPTRIDVSPEDRKDIWLDMACMDRQGGRNKPEHYGWFMGLIELYGVEIGDGSEKPI
jgi:hypothetical protein